MLEISVLLVACILNGLLGLVVYLNNPKSTTNKLFFALTGGFVAWSLINYASLHPFVLSQLMWIRLVLFAAALLCLLVFVTFTAFPDVRLEQKYRRRAVLATYLTALVMILTLTPVVFKSLSYSHGQATPVPAPGIGLFLIQSVGLLTAGVLTIIRKYRSSRDYKIREQLRLVLLGIAGTFLLIVSTNLLLVVIFNITTLVPFGPAFTLVFSTAFAYAIVRHKLFDVRLIVARSLAYIFSLLSLGVIFTVGAFSITNLFFNGNDIDIITLRWLYAFLAVSLAILFPSLKRFFDKLTNKLFFRDAYDTQAFLADFNRTLVVTYELDQLLRQSAGIIEENIKPTYCLFVINETENTEAKIRGSGNKARFEQGYIDKLKEAASHIRQKLIITDELGGGYESLQKQLRQEDIVLMARLTSSLGGSRPDVGYLMVGPKKSGNLYSSQDLKVIEIVANELVIAVQNALRFEEIRNFNLTLQAKVDEATKKLRRANEKLRQMDETKDDFISMASHQLRTPLTSVKGYIDMVMEGDAGKITQKQREMLGQAFFSSQRMVYLIADLLNVSRLDTGFVARSGFVPVPFTCAAGEELHVLERHVEAFDIHATPFEGHHTRRLELNFGHETILSRICAARFLAQMVFSTRPSQS